jgi:hypothetical protein
MDTIYTSTPVPMRLTSLIKQTLRKLCHVVILGFTLFFCVPETLDAQCGTNCSNCKFNCSLVWNPAIAALEAGRGSCQLNARYDWEYCLDYAEDWYYYTCMAGGDSGTCWTYLMILSMQCNSAFNQAYAQCSAQFDQQITDANNSRNQCNSDCERLEGRLRNPFLPVWAKVASFDSDLIYRSNLLCQIANIDLTFSQQLPAPPQKTIIN